MIISYSGSKKQKKFQRQELELASEHDKSHLIKGNGEVELSNIQSSGTAHKGTIVRASNTYGERIIDKIKKDDKTRYKISINPDDFEDVE